MSKHGEGLDNLMQFIINEFPGEEIKFTPVKVPDGKSDEFVYEISISGEIVSELTIQVDKKNNNFH